MPSLQDATKDLVSREFLGNVLVSHFGDRLKFVFDDPCVTGIPGLPQSTLNFDRCHIVLRVQFANVAQLHVLHMVCLVADKVSNLLDKLTVCHHFTKKEVSLHFGSQLGHHQKFPLRILSSKTVKTTDLSSSVRLETDAVSVGSFSSSSESERRILHFLKTLSKGTSSSSLS